MVDQRFNESHHGSRQPIDLAHRQESGGVRKARGHNRRVYILATAAISIEGSTLRRRKAESDDHTRCTRVPSSGIQTTEVMPWI